MTIKPIFIAAVSASSLFLTAGCGAGFTLAESSLIRSGTGDIMRVLTVADAGDSLLLRGKSAPLSAEMVQSDDYATLRRRMLATVCDTLNAGVGIAAPQVGVFRRLVAVQRFDKPGEPFEFYINPEIIASSEQVAPGHEGCLSVPELSGTVERFEQITLRYYDEQFAERTEQISGFTAVIFQHEIDHLNGTLFFDRMQKDAVSRE